MTWGAFFGGLAKLIGLSLKKSSFAIVGLFASKFSRRVSLGLIFLIIILIGSANVAYREKSFYPFAMKVGGIIGDADKNIYYEIEDFKKLADPSPWKALWSLLSILGQYYLLYLLILLFYYGYNVFDTSRVFRSTVLALLTVFTFHLAWSFFLMYLDGEWNGVKGLSLSQIWFIVKPAGTIEFVNSIGMYSENIAKLAESWYSMRGGGIDN